MHCGAEVTESSTNKQHHPNSHTLGRGDAPRDSAHGKSRRASRRLTAVVGNRALEIGADPHLLCHGPLGAVFRRLSEIEHGGVCTGRLGYLPGADLLGI